MIKPQTICLDSGRLGSPFPVSQDLFLQTFCRLFLLLKKWQTVSRCLKITENVSFNIASEASYVCILSEQKLIKKAKNGQFGEFLQNWSLRSNSVTRKVTFKRKKIDRKCQNSNATFWAIFKQCGNVRVSQQS